MSFEGVIFNKGQYGLNRQNASTDGVMALVVFSPEAENENFNKVLETIQAIDLNGAGFDESYDANNNILLRHHVEEFYRLAPLGTLKLIVTDKATAAAFFASDEAKAIFRTHSDVKRVGFVYNDNVVDLDLTAEANACQAFMDALEEDHILMDGMYLEGRNIGTGGTNMRELTAGKVSIVIGQDPNVASIAAAYANYAAIGSVLGMRAIRKVNENLGSVDVINKPDDKKGNENYSLTDEVNGQWLEANLSDGTPVSSLTRAERKQLTDTGYIYAGNFQGYAGYYLNGEPTSIEAASDFATGENNGIWNKAARGVRQALIPKVRGWFKRNAETGELSATATTNLENIASKPLNQMVGDEEISGYQLRIPTGQSPNDQTPLLVYITVRVGAIIHEFTVDLSLN